MLPYFKRQKCSQNDLRALYSDWNNCFVLFGTGSLGIALAVYVDQAYSDLAYLCLQSAAIKNVQSSHLAE